MRYLAVFLVATLPLAFTSPAPADERDARAANPAVKRVAAALYNDNLKREESQKSPSLWARFLGLDARQPQLVARESDDPIFATSQLPPNLGKRDNNPAFWKRLFHLEARDTVAPQATPYYIPRDVIPSTSALPSTYLSLFGRGVGPQTTYAPAPTAQKRDIWETVTLTVKKQ